MPKAQLKSREVGPVLRGTHADALQTALIERLAALHLAERHRIAREIHDTLAQGFAAIRIQLELARAQSGLPPQAAVALDLAYQIAGDNLVEARRSMAALKATQPSLETSLVAAIEGVRRLYRVKIVDALTAVPPPPDEVAHELVRIAQEAMLNAARHAEAQTVRVTMMPVPGGLWLAVVDDGKGFDPAKAAPGFGLAGLRERAAGIEAKLSIASTPGLGTEVVVTWISPGARDWTRDPVRTGIPGRGDSSLHPIAAWRGYL
jgi:signal transduction histidine kinase